MYFKLPIEQRMKKGVESLQLWIKIVDSIFRKRGAARQEKIDKWMVTLSTDTDLTQPKIKGKHGESTHIETGGNDTPTIVGGEEVL